MAQGLIDAINASPTASLLVKAKLKSGAGTTDITTPAITYSPLVLTGANADGAAGLARIKERGGVALVQDPETSAKREMPEAAIAATSADAVLPLEEIPLFLYGLCGETPS